MTVAQRVDRAALVRRSLVELVAARGFRGTSMAAVAERAGVATGTAYVHYASKDELVLAAYREVKDDMGAAALAALDGADDAKGRFLAVWHGIRRHLIGDPVRARFLAQVEASPYGAALHAAASDDGGSVLLEAIGNGILAQLRSLPHRVLYDLGLGPVVRLTAAGEQLGEAEIDVLADACWRAIIATEPMDRSPLPAPVHEEESIDDAPDIAHDRSSRDSGPPHREAEPPDWGHRW